MYEGNNFENKREEQIDSKEENKPSIKKRIISGLGAAAIVVSGMSSAEAVETKTHHLETKKEHREVGFGKVIPQSEEELAELIEKNKSESIKHHFSEIQEKIGEIGYRLLYFAQKNDFEGMQKFLPEYYHWTSRAKKELGMELMLTEIDKEVLNILIEDKHFDTAKKILKFIPDKKDQIFYSTKIGLAEHGN